MDNQTVKLAREILKSLAHRKGTTPKEFAVSMGFLGLIQCVEWLASLLRNIGDQQPGTIISTLVRQAVGAPPEKMRSSLAKAVRALSRPKSFTTGTIERPTRRDITFPDSPEPARPKGPTRKAAKSPKKVATANIDTFSIRGMGAENGAAATPTEARAGWTLEPGLSTIQVFFATDRDDTGSPLPAQRFGRKRADGMTYGIAEVTIPPGHRMGELESPSLWRLEFRPDPQKHVILRDIQVKPEGFFLDELRAAVAKSKEKQAFVFVHGYNVTFEDAARRTGQLAFDLGFDGAPILYSWPSQGTVPGYPVDRENAAWSIPHLETFLAKVARDTGAERIHAIAHSMGNQVLAGALDRLAAAAPPPIFNEVILTAPDIDAQVFQDLAARILPAARRTTLYASARDKALGLSYQFNGHRRAGDTREGVVVIPGMDTVDATRVNTSFLGHSYIGDEESVLSDLFYLIKGLACGQRHRLRPAAWQGQPYWEFKP